MDQTTKSAGLDRRVALVGGAGVFVAHVMALRPSGSGTPVAIVASVAVFVGFWALAFGLPDTVTGDADHERPREPLRRGLVGSSPIARWSLAAAGALAVLGTIAAALYPRDVGTIFSSTGRAFATVLTVVDYAGLLALVAAAVFVSSSAGAWRGARIGLRILAAIAVAQVLIPLTFGLLPTDALQLVFPGWLVVFRLLEVVACAVGIAFAWPWLAPHVGRGARAATRARDRWVDTTP